MLLDLNFYKNKVVLVTGHTGFKGCWLSKILIDSGAKVVGYSLKPDNLSLFNLSNIKNKMVSIYGDVRDYKKMLSVFSKYKPSCVFHLAAQPIVRESYKNPLYTYETNVVGTVNVLECVRHTKSVRSFINVTTDKVYLNDDLKNYAFKETDPLDGFDPYSNSKSCSEIITHSYSKSFFNDSKCSISTARAGNVIGGGDFSVDRIIPDCVRAIIRKKDIIVRNPKSTRPYQFVLEPLYIYLLIVEKQYNNKKYQGFYNIGPDNCDCLNTGELVDLFCKKWGNGIKWVYKSVKGPHEAGFLKLNNSKIKKTFGWKPIYHIDECVSETVKWYKVFLKDKEKIPQEMKNEIIKFFKKAR